MYLHYFCIINGGSLQFIRIENLIFPVVVVAFHCVALPATVTFDNLKRWEMEFLIILFLLFMPNILHQDYCHAIFKGPEIRYQQYDLRLTFEDYSKALIIYF